jgi:hypothetical protein
MQVRLAEVATTLTLEARLVRLDGHDFEAELILTPFHQRGQSAIQIILRDITARTQLERQLRAQSSPPVTSSGSARSISTPVATAKGMEATSGAGSVVIAS